MYLEPLTEKFDGDDDDLTWVIPGLLPNAVVILEGRGGLGKSSLISDIAAALTTGRTWPKRERKRGLAPAGVLLFAAEERRKDIRKRLVRAGGDGTKLFHTAKAHLYSELDELENAIKTKKAKLVVLDPVQDFLGINVRNPEETRWMMTQLDYLCDTYGCCIILIRHMRKDSNDQDPMEDGGLGTGQLRNFTRAVYRLIIDPDDDTRRLLLVTKFNYGPYPDTLVYRWNEKGRLAWDDKPSRWNAFNLISRPKDEIKRVQARECDKWMKRYFRANGYRVAARECLAEGSRLGFSNSTVQRTRVKLNITNTRLGWGQGSQYMWTHPLYDPNKEQDPDLMPPPDGTEDEDE